MNLRNLLTLIIISAGVMCGSAQTISTKHAHRAAHQQQLANAKLRMDKNVIRISLKTTLDAAKMLLPTRTNSLLNLQP